MRFQKYLEKYLELERIPRPDLTAREMLKALEQYPHWQSSSEQERQVRIAITAELVKSKVPAKRIAKYTERILLLLHALSDSEVG